MTQPKHKPSKPTARHMLEQSQLTHAAAKGLEGLNDVDLEDLVLRVSKSAGIRAIDAIEDIVLDMTVEGASTLTATLLARDYKILREGGLSRTTDVEVDGLWFRLAQLRSNQYEVLELVFEDREVRVLKTYDKQLGPVSRSKVTRAEFVQRMADEASKELKIRTFIPQLHDIQPIEVSRDALAYANLPGAQQQGIPKRAGFRPTREASDISKEAHRHGESLGLTIKGSPADNIQIKNINTILRTGASQGARRKVLVCSIMTTIQEASARNLPPAEDPAHAFQADSVGAFQQRKSQGWPASQDVAKDAVAFFDKAIGLDRAKPGLQYWELCADVQNPREDLRTRYSDWRTEAERFVNAYGVPGSDSESSMGSTSDPSLLGGGTDYFYYRGVPPTAAHGKWKKENSWACAQRLASEVQWRSFMRAGVWWFVTEDWLLKSMPVATWSPLDDDVQEVTFDFDEGKLTGQLQFKIFMKRWAAPPGSVVKVQDVGPLDGRWFVAQITRPMFDELATVTLKKPMPKLPEPSQNNLQNANQYSAEQADASDQGQKYKVATAIINPIPIGKGGDHGARHNTLGLSDYPAYDFFAKPGTPVLAVESGKIARFSGHNPLLGPTNDGINFGQQFSGGALGWTIYLEGDSGTTYFITHLGTRATFVGAQVSAGEQIGTVADYDSWGRKSHTHIGVHSGPSGHPNADDLAAAPQAVK